MSLDHWGLSPAAQSVYQVLLAGGSPDMAALAVAAGVGESATREALDELAGLALVRWEDDDLSSLALRSPGAALHALAREQAEIAERQLRIEQSRAAIADLFTAHEPPGGGASADVERVTGLKDVRERIAELSAACQEDVWSFNPDGPQTASNLAHSRPLNSASLERGIRMRAVYLDSVRNDEASLVHLNELAEQGAEVRTVSLLPLRMIIVDRSVAVVPVDERNTADGVLVLTGRGVVAALVALFVATWTSARTLGPRPGRGPGELSHQESAALRLWARGATDVVVARHLGISERTVRRISETLHDRLDAKSRFEAGARAVDIGWLSGDDLG